MKLGAKSEDGEGWGLWSDPRPDIHELFSHYNSLYFDGALGGCIVYWSDSRFLRSHPDLSNLLNLLEILWPALEIMRKMQSFRLV